MRRALPQVVVDSERSRDAGVQRCRKVRYRNGRVARVVAARSTKEHGKDFSPYKCGFCGWWHLTTHPYPTKGAA